MPPAAKTTGNYVNSSLAKVEALNAGYDEAVLLNRAGCIAECSGENLFVITNGKITTPPLHAGALEGITQHTVTQLLADMGHEVGETNLVRPDPYTADEAFLVGTAAEVSAVNSVDDRPIACPGAITTELAKRYANVVRGGDDKYRSWVELP